MTKQQFLASVASRAALIQTSAQALRSAVDRTFIHPTAIKPCPECNAVRELVGLPLITESTPKE